MTLRKRHSVVLVGLKVISLLIGQIRRKEENDFTFQLSELMNKLKG